MGVCIGCCRGTDGGGGSEHVVLKRRCQRGVEVRVGILIGFGVEGGRGFLCFFLSFQSSFYLPLAHVTDSHLV